MTGLQLLVGVDMFLDTGFYVSWALRSYLGILDICFLSFAHKL